MRIRSEQFRPRRVVISTVVIAVLAGLIDLAGQGLVGSGAGSWVLHAVCGLGLLWWVSTGFRMWRKCAATWVDVSPAGISWSAPDDVVQRAGLASPGSLDADEVAGLAVVDGLIRLRLLVGTKRVRVLQLQVTAADGRTFILPHASSHRQTSPAMRRLLDAIHATPGLPAIDVSRLPATGGPATFVPHEIQKGGGQEQRDRWARFRGLTWWQGLLSLLPLALIPIGGAVGGGIGGLGAVANLRLARNPMSTLGKAVAMTSVVVLTYGTAAVVLSGVRSMFFGQPVSPRSPVATPWPTWSPHIQPTGDDFVPSPVGSGAPCALRQAPPDDQPVLHGPQGIVVVPTVVRPSGAELTWPSYSAPSLDVIGYQVHRATCPAFEPSDSTLVAQVPSGVTSFVDTTAPQGADSYYMVVAVTRAGLVPGVVRTVQVPAASSTTVVLPAQVATTLSSNHPTTVMNTLKDVNKSEPGVDVGVEAASDGTARGVFVFGALTGVPRDAQVLDAHLDLSVQGTDLPGTLYDVGPLTRRIVGAQVTWTRASAALPWSRPGGDFAATAAAKVPSVGDDVDRREFDVAAVVRGWIAAPASGHALLLKVAHESTAHGLVSFAGLETAVGAPSELPTLTITYALPTT